MFRTIWGQTMNMTSQPGILPCAEGYLRGCKDGIVAGSTKSLRVALERDPDALGSPCKTF